MNDREFEMMVEHALKCDLSVGTEAFRDALLVRCLSELHDEGIPCELDDGELELLVAAGDLDSQFFVSDI